MCQAISATLKGLTLGTHASSNWWRMPNSLWHYLVWIFATAKRWTKRTKNANSLYAKLMMLESTSSFYRHVIILSGSTMTIPDTRSGCIFDNFQVTVREQLRNNWGPFLSQGVSPVSSYCRSYVSCRVRAVLPFVVLGPGKINMLNPKKHGGFGADDFPETLGWL